METVRLPFEISGLYGGCAKIEGFATSTAESLSLEFRMSDTLIGAWNSGISTRQILWSDLERAECGLGFFMPWLLLHARSLSAFDKLPSKQPGQLRLRIPWRCRRPLRALTAEINLHLSYAEADRYRLRLSDNVG
jgi:hypothetical protein